MTYFKFIISLIINDLKDVFRIVIRFYFYYLEGVFRLSIFFSQCFSMLMAVFLYLWVLADVLVIDLIELYSVLNYNIFGTIIIVNQVNKYDEIVVNFF